MAIDAVYIVTATSTGAAAANNVTLAASTVGQRTYIAGFNISGTGATAQGVIAVTITGLLGGTINYSVNIPVLAGAGVHFAVKFDPPLPSSAINTAVVVNVPSFGAGNTAASVTAYGYLS